MDKGAAQPRPYMPYGQPMYEQYAPGQPFCGQRLYDAPMYQQPYGDAQYPGQPHYAPNSYSMHGDQHGYGVGYDGYGQNYGQQGMSNGAKMAMAGAGGLALGAGAAFAMDHAGEIGHFAEDAVEDVERFVQDIF